MPSENSERRFDVDAITAQNASRRSLIANGLRLSAVAGVAAATGASWSTARAQDATPSAMMSATPTADVSMIGGEPVDPQMQEVLKAFLSFGAPPISEVAYDVARNLPSFANAVALVEQEKGAMMPPKVSIKALVVPGPEGDIACRAHRPMDAADSDKLPVVAYFHGGGFVIANLDTYERSCIALADMAKCLVVSVAYRQAPEHPFTAAVDDAYAVTQWLMSNADQIGGDPSKVATAGESAGGNLATVVCLKAKDEGGMMPVHQLLVFPITTYAPQGNQTESIQKFAQGILLTAPALDWFAKYYLSDPTKDAQNAYSSPILAKDFSGLPPATMISAQLDPLQSQGTAYAETLKNAGIPVTQTIYKGVTHEFFGMGSVVDVAKQAEMDAANALMQAFSGGGMATPANGMATPTS
jgi:acetyl esterase